MCGFVAEKMKKTKGRRRGREAYREFNVRHREEEEDGERLGRPVSYLRIHPISSGVSFLLGRYIPCFLIMAQRNQTRSNGIRYLIPCKHILMTSQNEEKSSEILSVLENSNTAVYNR